MSLRARLNQLIRLAQAEDAVRSELVCSTCHSPSPILMSHVLIEAGEVLPTCSICGRILSPDSGPYGQVLVVHELHDLPLGVLDRVRDGQGLPEIQTVEKGPAREDGQLQSPRVNVT
jgi:hypothetical protein